MALREALMKQPVMLWPAVVLVAIVAGTAPALARGALVCLAASDPADAAKPLPDIVSLEFYADEGNPALSYSFPLALAQSITGADGRTRNAYRVRNGSTAGATIVFAGATPLSFAVAELGRTFTSLARNDEETEFMADAVPGIACYSATTDEAPL
jgi:hypothetical protein